MIPRNMHENEADVDIPLVRRLLVAQFPQWADLPIEHVASAGTDNAIYRLGHDMAVRLPRIEAATAQVEKEHSWLPRLAPQLPLAIPVPLAKGRAAHGYPWRWSIYRWLDGKPANTDGIDDLKETARAVAGFVAALQRIDAAEGPAPGEHNFFRGVPLAQREEPTRAALEQLDRSVDTNAVRTAWQAALEVPEHAGPSVWIHGDLSPGNLLVVDGRLNAVIDFGALAVGDPACDLIVAWNLLPVVARDVFRAALSVDDAEWARGRGWALSIALIQLPYYQNTNPLVAGNARHVIHEVLVDQEHRTTAER